MTALAAERDIDQIWSQGEIQSGVDGGSSIYEGAMVTALTATGYVVKAGTASAGQVLGVAAFTVDNSAGSDGAKSLDLLQGIFRRGNSGSNAVTQAHLGKKVYAEDDQTISSLATDTLAGVMVGFDDAGNVLVWIQAGSVDDLIADLASVASGYGASMIGAQDAAGRFAGTNLETVTTDIGARIALAFDDTTAQTAYSATARADRQIAIVDNDDAGAQADGSLWLFDSSSAAGASDYVRVPDAGTGRWLRLIPTLAELAAVTAATGGNLLGYDDSGSKTTAATVADALDELYVDATSTKGRIDIPITSFIDVAATQLTTFVDGASDQPGLELTGSEALNIRWNNHAAPLAVTSSFQVPEGADVTADMTLEIVCAKTGATIGDATTFTITAFNQVVGALYDADADYGGATSAVTGDAATKTVQEVSLTLALANLPAVGSNVTLTIKPTGGTLGTDDMHMIAVRVAYTKMLTS